MTVRMCVGADTIYLTSHHLKTKTKEKNSVGADMLRGVRLCASSSGRLDDRVWSVCLCVSPPPGIPLGCVGVLSVMPCLACRQVLPAICHIAAS